MSEFEEIKSNWEKFESLASKLNDTSISALLERLGDRIAIAPWSDRVEHGWCRPGGLVQHTLDVVSIMLKIADAAEMKNVEKRSILKVGLLFDLGRVGTENDELFVEQESDWHREKLGQLYKYSEKLPRMPMAHRSLYLLQASDIKFTLEEWIAIQCSGDRGRDETATYRGQEPAISNLLCSAIRLVQDR